MERFAILLLTDNLYLLPIILVSSYVLGLLCGVIVNRKSTRTISRSVFWSFSCFTVLGQTSILATLPILPLILTNGYLHFLLVAVILVCMALGYGGGLLSILRSNDAFGRSNFALLGIIPLANVIFFLKPSSSKNSKWNFGGLAGIATGCLGLALSIALLYVLVDPINTALDDVDEKDWWIVAIKVDGVEGAIASTAEGIRPDLPIEVDEFIKIVDVRANGVKLSYIYETAPDVELLYNWRNIVTAEECRDKRSTFLMEYGAIIELVYISSDDTVIGSQLIDKTTCDQFAIDPKSLAPPPNTPA